MKTPEYGITPREIIHTQIMRSVRQQVREGVLIPALDRIWNNIWISGVDHDIHSRGSALIR